MKGTTMKNQRRKLYDTDRFLATASQRLAARHVLDAVQADFSERLSALLDAMQLDPREADALRQLWREAATNARVQLSPHVEPDMEGAELTVALTLWTHRQGGLS